MKKLSKQAISMDGTFLSSSPPRTGKLMGIVNDSAWLWSEVITLIIFAAVYWGIVGLIMWLIFK